MVVDDDRCRGQEVLLIEVGDFLVPTLLARTRIERDQVIVWRDEEEVVAPHGGAAIADVRATSRPPEEAPQQVTVLCIERPDVVWRSDIQDAVDGERGALDRRRPNKLAVADTAFNDRGRRRPERWCDYRGARPRGHGRRPGQAEVLHVRLVDLLERAVASSGVVARIGRP